MKDRRIRAIGLLLGAIFLAGQFHTCVDLATAAPALHICPICLSGAWALPAHSLDVSVVWVERWIEVSSRTRTPDLTPAHAIASRAPPAA